MDIRSLFRRKRSQKPGRVSRWSLLIWSTVAALICGTIEFGEPVEDLMRIYRNGFHTTRASGDIVVVGIDDRSVKTLGQWPWPRRYHAQLLDKLTAMGAKRVFFDYNFSQASDPTDDRLFAEALARHPGKAVIPIRFVVDPITNKRVNAPPYKPFASNAVIGNINAWRSSFGWVWNLPFGMKIDGTYYPSFANLLSHRKLTEEQSFPIDYSIQFNTVPRYNTIDVLNGTTPKGAFEGKEVAVALLSDRLGDSYILPGQGLTGGVYIQILGAETLKRGLPLQIGWLIPLGLSLLLTWGYLGTKRRWLSIGLLATGTLSLTILPVLLESHMVYADIVPAMLLFGIATSVRTWRQVKERSATVNALSGLPNLNALRRYNENAAIGAPLVAARIQNYSEITASLPNGTEELLILEIVRRFDLGVGGSTLFQGDDGLFVWLGRRGSASSIGDEVEGLHALLTSPVIVAGQQVDLTVTFGVDAGDDRQIANRVGSALVAADDAFASGLKWKAYDAARLQDAEWKLSLLGRLDAAIDSGEIWVAYQPKLNIATNRIIGAEALVRWSHPEKGPIAPDEFIGVAEQHNRIEKLTTHVLHEAIKAGALINAHGMPFNVAVNLSARLLESPHLVQFIIELLQAHKLDPHNLTIEVTESAEMAGNSHSVKMLEEMQAAGIKISIDDYGTGFSTLDYMRTIPATEIKIDKSFIAAMDRNQSDRLMVNSTIQLAHSLGRTVVAEGVETPTILRALTEMGCDKAQGWLIGRPMKLVGITRMLLAERRKLAA